MLFKLDSSVRDGISLTSLSGAWPPSAFGFCLAALISKMDLYSKTVLDVGCGSGIQGIVAAKLGAVVCASDISEDAVHSTHQNAAASSVTINARPSPGLEPWKGKKFDLVICNGPTFEPGRESSIGQSTGTQRLRPIPMVTLDVLELHDRFLNPNGRIVGLVCGPYASGVVQAAAANSNLHIEAVWNLSYEGPLGDFGGSFDSETALQSGLAHCSSNGAFCIKAAVFVARRASEVAR